MRWKSGNLKQQGQSLTRWGRPYQTWRGSPPTSEIGWLWREITTCGFHTKDVFFQSTPTSVGRWICSCGDRNCSRRETVRLGIDTLIANILVSLIFAVWTEILRKTEICVHRLRLRQLKDNMAVAWLRAILQACCIPVSASAGHNQHSSIHTSTSYSRHLHQCTLWALMNATLSCSCSLARAYQRRW